MMIIFSGRRWRIVEIHDRDKTIEVTADLSGRPPPFGGTGGLIHDRVAKKMFEVLAAADRPVYIDDTAAHLLQRARSEFRRLNFVNQPICRIGERTYLIATSAGTVKTSTLALILRAKGYTTESYDGFLHVSQNRDVVSVETAIESLVHTSPLDASHFLSGSENLLTEKFHPYLGPDLLLADATSSRLDLQALPGLARRLVTPFLIDSAFGTDQRVFSASTRNSTRSARGAPIASGLGTIAAHAATEYKDLLSLAGISYGRR